MLQLLVTLLPVMMFWILVAIYLGGWSVDSFILARSAPPVTVCTCTKPARVPTHKPPF